MTIFLISGAKGSGKTHLSQILAAQNDFGQRADVAEVRSISPLTYVQLLLEQCERRKNSITVLDGANDPELVKLIRGHFPERVVHFHMNVADMLPWERWHVENSDFTIMSTELARRLLFSLRALAGERARASETDPPSGAEMENNAAVGAVGRGEAP